MSGLFIIFNISYRDSFGRIALQSCSSVSNDLHSKVAWHASMLLLGAAKSSLYVQTCYSDTIFSDVSAMVKQFLSEAT